MNAHTHEVRKYDEGEGSGTIVFTGTYDQCRNAKRRFERKHGDWFTFCVYRVDETPKIEVINRHLGVHADDMAIEISGGWIRFEVVGSHIFMIPDAGPARTAQRTPSWYSTFSAAIQEVLAKLEILCGKKGWSVSLKPPTAGVADEFLPEGVEHCLSCAASLMLNSNGLCRACQRRRDERMRMTNWCAVDIEEQIRTIFRP